MAVLKPMAAELEATVEDLVEVEATAIHLASLPGGRITRRSIGAYIIYTNDHGQDDDFRRNRHNLASTF